uniref:Uncharacterized protein n=1 Tax=Timema douglasi TaxID=61478 RepID=A0A7R8VLK8_TIMDO|nr:unnamed protein product [Timema douglasi]
MEDNLDTSSSKKDEMQLGPEYLVKDKIKIEPMLSGRIADIPVVTWPNSNIPEADVREVKLTTRLLGAGRGADLVPVSVSLLYPSHESGCVVARVCVPFDGERSRSDLMEFNSIKYFDGAVKSEVQDIFEPSSKSGSPSAELEEMGPTGLKPQAFASCLEQPSHLAAANRLPTASSSHLGLGFPLMILSIIRPNQGAGALTQDGLSYCISGIEFLTSSSVLR